MKFGKASGNRGGSGGWGSSGGGKGFNFDPMDPQNRSLMIFGALAGATLLYLLSEENYKEITFRDFMQYLEKGQVRIEMLSTAWV